MNINNIDKEDVEELFVWLSVLVRARHCDNAVALEIEKKMLEKFKKIVGFSPKDVEIVRITIDEYASQVATLKEVKEMEGGENNPKISLEEREKIFWDIICKK